MPLDPDVILGTITEAVRFDRFGNTYRVKVITYTVGQDGPFNLEVIPGQDTEAGISERINAEAAKIHALRGTAPQ